MCVEVITKWPCGHTKSEYEFCKKAQPKRRIVVFLNKANPKPLAPCEEQTQRSVQASSADRLCNELRCKERLLWMCCKCPALPGLAETLANPTSRSGKKDNKDHAPYTIMNRTVQASLNAGWRCGSSEPGTPKCGHRRCSNCITWRRCRCGCRCRHMIPPSRHVCRPCAQSSCRSQTSRDKAAKALDAALANLAERLQPEPKKEQEEEDKPEEQTKSD